MHHKCNVNSHLTPRLISAKTNPSYSITRRLRFKEYVSLLKWLVMSIKISTTKSVLATLFVTVRYLWVFIFRSWKHKQIAGHANQTSYSRNQSVSNNRTLKSKWTIYTTKPNTYFTNVCTTTCWSNLAMLTTVFLLLYKE